MALATPTISYVDGTGNASTNLNANASAYVTPGNVLTLALQSTAGVVQADLVIVAPGTPLDGFRPARIYSSPFSWSFQLPQQPVIFTANVEVFDGNNASYNTNVFFSLQKTAGMVHRARGVCITAQTLATFASVTGGTIVDGVTYAQGDVVLLVNQGTASQNGPYYVGAVAAGSAPLTRVPDFATGAVLAPAQTCEVSEGTVFANSTWKITTTGNITVDTTNHAWYPRVQRGTGATGGGTTVSLTTLWAFASTSTMLANDVSGAAAVQCGAIVAGAGTGTCTLTGTTAHTLSWALLNW